VPGKATPEARKADITNPPWTKYSKNRNSFFERSAKKQSCILYENSTSMEIQKVSDNPDDFKENKCLLVKNLISDDCRKLLTTMLALDEAGDKRGNQVPGSIEVYNSVALNTVNQMLLNKIKKITNLPYLYSTYAFYRKYYEDQPLEKHTDRPECEVSITISLADSEPQKEWPIYLQDPVSKTVYEGYTEPGDGVIYLGCELVHWREPCNKKWVKQFFSHYSPNSNLEFDHAAEKSDNELMRAQYIRSILELT